MKGWSAALVLVALTATLGAEEVTHTDGSVLIRVPEGRFRMGGDKGPSDQRPSHAVSVPAFWIGKYEVSNALFQLYISKTGRPAPALWADLSQRWGPQAPALGLSHRDALGYCEWAGLRLLSEVEWERAARPAHGLFPWGSVFQAERCWSSVAAAVEEPHAVDGLESGQSWCGCLHMAGNAWEWTDSWYQPYPGNQVKKREFGSKFKVLRGGCWQYRSPDFLQVTYRSWNLTVARLPHYGFRVARDESARGLPVQPLPTTLNRL